MAKIRYSDEFVCPKCGRHTALVCHVDGTHQAHCMICDAYYNVEIATMTNAGRIRAMTDEELAAWIYQVQDGDALRKGNFMPQLSKSWWLDWLKQEVSNGNLY